MAGKSCVLEHHLEFHPMKLQHRTAIFWVKRVANGYFFLEANNIEMGAKLPLDSDSFPEVVFMPCDISHKMWKLLGKETS